MSGQINHVSLDVWQTIILSNLEFKKRRNQLLAEHFAIKKPFAFVESVAKKRQAWCTEVNELGGKALESVDILLLILKDCDVDTRAVSSHLLSQFYTLMEVLFLEYPPIVLDPEIFPILEQLKSHGITVSLLSNTGLINGCSLNKFFDQVDLRFDFTIFSDEIGFSKPSPIVFEEVFNKIRSRKNIGLKEIVHIGDNRKADFDGATSFGFRAYLVDTTENTVSSYIKRNVFNLRNA